MRYRFLSKDSVFKDNRHILTLAISGSGKTNYIETISLDAHDTKKFKVIFFDLFKYEGCQFGFPETGKMAWLIRNKFFSQPRGYSHEVLIPFAITTFDRVKRGKMVIGLPKHKRIEKGKAYTNWKPFKLSFSQLKASDLSVVLRLLTAPGKVSLEFLHSLHRYETIDALMKEVIRLASVDELRVGFAGEETTAVIGKKVIYQAILRLLSNVQKSGFFCDNKNPFRLDLDAIMRSDEVTTFTFANLDDDDFRFMVFVSILRQIKELRAVKKYKKELLLVIPELADLAPSTSQISPAAITGDYSALHIMQIFSRHSRPLKITLVCDTQLPRDCNKTVLGNFGWLVLGSLQRNMVRWVHENLTRIPDIPYYKIPNLQTGVFCILPMEKKYYCYPFFARPCLARHRRRGDDVRSWVGRQDGIEVVSYKDDIKSSLQAKIIDKNEVELTEAQQTLVDVKREMGGIVSQARVDAKEILKEAGRTGKEEIKGLKEQFKQKEKEKKAKIKERQRLKVERVKEIAKMKVELKKGMEREQLALKVKELQEGGESIGEIAKKLGKSKSTIHKYLSVRSFS